MDINKRLLKAHISYNYCSICGRVPKEKTEEPNYAPLSFWDCDDGWKIGTLCRWCAHEVLNRKPQPNDYAYHKRNRFGDNIETDEDPSEAF